MSIFDEDLGAVQQESLESKDKKSGGGAGERYFELPKNKEGHPYEVLKLSVGANKFDIMPFKYAGGFLPACTEGRLTYKLDVDVYKNIGPSNSDVLSLKQQMKQDPIADELSSLYNQQKELSSQDEKDKFYKDKIAPLRAKRRCMYVVLHHQDDGKKVPKILETSHFKFEKQLQEAIELEAAKGNNVGIFSHPTKGSTILVMGKEETFNGNKFVDIASVSFTKRTQQLAKDEASAEKMLDSIPSLDACLNIKTPEEVETLLYGVSTKAVTEEASEPEKPSFTDSLVDEEVEQEEETSEDVSTDDFVF